LVQNHAADELDVEVPLPERALGRLATGGECLDQNVIEARSLRHLLLERVRARAQRLIRELLELPLQRVDRGNPRKIRLDPAFVRRTEQLAGNGADHAVGPSGPLGYRYRTLPNPTGRNAERRCLTQQRLPASTHGRGMREKCRTFRSSSMQTAAAAVGSANFVER